jgi:hypothetical protein
MPAGWSQLSLIAHVHQLEVLARPGLRAERPRAKERLPAPWPVAVARRRLVHCLLPAGVSGVWECTHLRAERFRRRRKKMSAASAASAASPPTTPPAMAPALLFFPPPLLPELAASPSPLPFPSTTVEPLAALVVAPAAPGELVFVPGAVDCCDPIPFVLVAEPLGPRVLDPPGAVWFDTLWISEGLGAVHSPNTGVHNDLVNACVRRVPVGHLECV